MSFSFSEINFVRKTLSEIAYERSIIVKLRLNFFFFFFWTALEISSNLASNLRKFIWLFDTHILTKKKKKNTIKCIIKYKKKIQCNCRYFKLTEKHFKCICFFQFICIMYIFFISYCIFIYIIHSIVLMSIICWEY